MDLFGAGRYTLTTQNIPLLEELYQLPANTDSVFHSEIYFINMTTQMGIKWGTDSKVRLFDPLYGLHVEIGACGNFNLRVSNSRKLLLKLVGTDSELSCGSFQDGKGFETTQLVGKFKALIINRVKSNLAKAIKELHISILEIDEHIDELSEKIRGILNETLDNYGLVIPEFFITSVLTPDDDPQFKRLKQQFGEKTLKVREEEIRQAEAAAAQSRKILEAQTEVQLKLVGAQGEAEALKIKAMAEAEAYKARAFAEAEEMRAKGYTYQQETARQVGMEAMKNGIIGEGGGGSLGDLAGLGITLGALGGVANMTKEVMTPVLHDYAQIGTGVVPETEPETAENLWNCSCGKTNIVTPFCPECGTKKPEPQTTWTCSCGAANLTSKFCPECGSMRKEN